jgi:hypothetical protein
MKSNPMPTRPRSAARAAWSLGLYWALVVLFFALQNSRLMPAWLEAPFSALVFPGVLFLALLAQALIPWGMASGEWIKLPQPAACLALMALSVAGVWAVATLWARRRR